MMLDREQRDSARIGFAEAVLATVCSVLLVGPWLSSPLWAIVYPASPAIAETSPVEGTEGMFRPVEACTPEFPVFRKHRSGRSFRVDLNWSRPLVSLQPQRAVTLYHHQNAHAPVRAQIVCNHDFADGLRAPLLC